MLGLRGVWCVLSVEIVVFLVVPDGLDLHLLLFLLLSEDTLL